MARRRSRQASAAEAEVSPAALVEERLEHGVLIRRYAPGWAEGAAPQKNLSQAIGAFSAEDDVALDPLPLP